jgi:hypothetical protein
VSEVTLTKDQSRFIFKANKKLNIIDENILQEYMKPGFLLQKGFSVKDI